MDKNTIYDRLLGLHFKIEVQTIPSPRYINEKICECHFYIEEIEKYSIETSKEISVFQQALNNSQAEYETKRENYLINDEEIKNLPNIKDREAKVNSKLRLEIEKIRGYQNEMSDLNNLLKAINLKIKNLNRANGDIKILLRTMEAQLKLSPSHGSDSAVKSLMEELNKSTIGQDSFEGSNSEQTEQSIIDPTSPVNVSELFGDISEKMLDPVPDITPEDIESENEESDEQELDDPENEDEQKPEEDEEWLPDQGQEDIAVTENKTIDIDQVIDGKEIQNQKGGDTIQKGEIVDEPKKVHQDQLGLDIDDLLDSIQFKK